VKTNASSLNAALRDALQLATNEKDDGCLRTSGNAESLFQKSIEYGWEKVYWDESLHCTLGYTTGRRVKTRLSARSSPTRVSQNGAAAVNC
jgi:hypothetical protein